MPIHTGYTIEARGSDLAIDEWSSGFEMVHKPTGRRHWIGDGVDMMFFTPAGRPISPGTKSWERAAKHMLRDEEDELYMAYFS